ncbi:MAG: PorT family protein [Cytophagales bacterium]|nr:MAG: PorT family protein [Cytophagales bacterium]
MFKSNYGHKCPLHLQKVIYIIGFLLILIHQINGQDASFKERTSKWSSNNLPYYDDRRLHYGFTLGLNSTRFKPTFSKNYFSNEEDSVVSVTGTRTTGFTLGFILNLKLTDFLDLRLLPTVAFYQRDMNFVFKNSFTTTQTTESTFIEIPLMCKYKSQRRGNFRMYMVGGLKAAIEAGAKKKEKKDTELRSSNFDLCIDYGFGLDIYYPLFKFSPEIRFSHGLLNMLNKDDNIYSRSIQRISTHTISLFLHFE